MKGQVIVYVNNATLCEAMQEYFDRHLRDGLQMTVKSVENDPNTYGSLGVKVTLAEKEAAIVTTGIA